MNTRFEQNFKSSVEFATKKFLEHGELTQTILLGWDEGEGTSAIVVFGDYDDDVRSNMEKILDESIKKIQREEGVEGQPDWFIQIAESWMIKVDKDDVPKEGPLSDIRPSEHPDREEVLIVHGNCKDGTSKTWTVPIYREPNLHLGEPDETITDAEARISNLLWKKDTRKIGDVFNEMMGENPSDQEVLIASSGWINATVKSELGGVLPTNIRMGLLRAANLIEKHAATL